jgi:organic radical activating enzyme
MRELRDLVDVVSMDFKLPSATGLRAFWKEHREFLAALRGRQVFVKAVVTGDTTVEDVTAAAALIAEVDPSVLLVVQPASGPLAPATDKLLKFQEKALRIIDDVRVIPQVHKVLGVP